MVMLSFWFSYRCVQTEQGKYNPFRFMDEGVVDIELIII